MDQDWARQNNELNDQLKNSSFNKKNCEGKDSFFHWLNKFRIFWFS